MPTTDPTALSTARSGPTRAAPVALIVVAGVLLAARIAFGLYEHARPIERADRVEWREPAAGETEAREGDRIVLYWFTRDRDARCGQMAREVFGDPRVADALEKQFVPVRVLDRSREDGGRNSIDVSRLIVDYSVKEFPALVVAYPGRERFEKLEGYPGSLSTMQFLSRAVGAMRTAPAGR